MVKLWRATTRDPHEGTVYAWARSARDAAKAKQQMQQNGFQNPIGLEPVEIPTTKAGLVEWLNLNFTTDNG